MQAAEERRAAVAMLRRAASTREAQTNHEETMRKLTASPLPQKPQAPRLRRSRTLPTLSTLANIRAANMSPVAAISSNTTNLEVPGNESNTSLDRAQVRQNLMRKLSERHLRRRSKSVGAIASNLNELQHMRTFSPTLAPPAFTPSDSQEDLSTAEFSSAPNGLLSRLDNLSFSSIAPTPEPLETYSQSTATTTENSVYELATESFQRNSSSSDIDGYRSSTTSSRRSPIPAVIREPNHNAIWTNSQDMESTKEVLDEGPQRNISIRSHGSKNSQQLSFDMDRESDTSLSVRFPTPDPGYRFPAQGPSQSIASIEDSVTPLSPKSRLANIATELRPPSSAASLVIPSPRYASLPRERILKKIQSVIKPHTSPQSVSPLDNPPRRFLEHGPILQVINENSIKRRYLFLFSDCLLVVKPLSKSVENNAPADLLNTQYMPKALISLDGLSLSDSGYSYTNLHTSSTSQALMRQFAINFAKDPSSAIQSLLSTSLESAHRPDSIAKLLANTVALDPVHMANYLCRKENEQTLCDFVDYLKLSSFDVDNALRILLAYVKPPRHLGTVESLLEKFCGRYVQNLLDEPEGTILTYELVRKLTLAIMELDDALHFSMQSPYDSSIKVDKSDGEEQGDDPTIKLHISGKAFNPNDRETASGLFSFPNSAITQADFVEAFRMKDQTGIIDDNKLASIYRSIRRIPLAQPPAPFELEASRADEASIKPAELSFGSEPLPDLLIYRRPSSRITLSTKSPIPGLRVKVIAPAHVQIQLVSSQTHTSSNASSFSTPMSSKLSLPTLSSGKVAPSSEMYISFAATTSYSFDITPNQLEGPHLIYFILTGPASATTRFSGNYACTRPYVWKFSVQKEFMANTFVLNYTQKSIVSHPSTGVAASPSTDKLTQESMSSKIEKQPIGHINILRRRYCFSASENYQAHLKWTTLLKQRIEAIRAKSRPRLKAQHAAECVAWMALEESLFSKDKSLAKYGSNSQFNHTDTESTDDHELCEVLKPNERLSQNSLQDQMYLNSNRSYSSVSNASNHPSQQHPSASPRSITSLRTPTPDHASSTHQQSKLLSSEPQNYENSNIYFGRDLVTLVQQNSLLPAILALLNKGTEVAPHPIKDANASAYIAQSLNNGSDVKLASSTASTEALDQSTSTDRTNWV